MGAVWGRPQTGAPANGAMRRPHNSGQPGAARGDKRRQCLAAWPIKKPSMMDMSRPSGFGCFY